jgi:hypothetical protein
MFDGSDKACCEESPNQMDTCVVCHLRYRSSSHWTLFIQVIGIDLSLLCHIILPMFDSKLQFKLTSSAKLPPCPVP